MTITDTLHRIIGYLIYNLIYFSIKTTVFVLRAIIVVFLHHHHSNNQIHPMIITAEERLQFMKTLGTIMLIQEMIGYVMATRGNPELKSLDVMIIVPIMVVVEVVVHH